ncbi:N-acetyltransferase p20 [Carex littledalei]|uniref:N-acetyltransferase p20 n=1 Tax=Carex littledalei TaxID=544730 RepID=A0A833RGK8_9POAL|nr:N-acetyltransferase p20 [Carex littledalei]
MNPEVTLRPFDLADLDDFYAWASDDLVSVWCCFDTYTNKEDLLNFMKRFVLPHPWMRAICYYGRPVGAIVVTPHRGEAQCRGELGYMLATQYWGKGIVTKAVQLVLRTVFEDLKDIERIEALVNLENVRSQRVLEKSGFTKDGVLRKYLIHKGKVKDIVLYSFISTDPLE